MGRSNVRSRVHSPVASVLVTSAKGANGGGYGAVLGFSADGSLIGPFSRDRRITDPRGLSHDQTGELVYVNSGDDRVLALDRRGKVVLDSGRIDDLDPGGAVFGPDGRYYVGLRQRRTILALPPRLDRVGEAIFLTGSFLFLGVSASDTAVISIWPQALVLRVRVTRTRSLCSITEELCAHRNSSTTLSSARSILSSLRMATS